MLKYRRIAAFLISFFFFCPNDAFAHRAGEYVPLNASVTADSLTGAESIDLENYQFEGSNVTDTNIHDSGTDFIGYEETRYLDIRQGIPHFFIQPNRNKKTHFTPAFPADPASFIVLSDPPCHRVPPSSRAF